MLCVPLAMPDAVLLIILGIVLNISACFLHQTGSSQRAGTVSLPATEMFNKYCQMSVQMISLNLHHYKGALFPPF